MGFGHRSVENGSVNFTRDFQLHVAKEILRFKVNDQVQARVGGRQVDGWWTKTVEKGAQPTASVKKRTLQLVREQPQREGTFCSSRSVPFALCVEVMLRPCKPVSMHRKGWTVMEVPNLWYEVLRGPRPPSVRWPVASRRQPSQTRKPSRLQPKKSSAQPTQSSSSKHAPGSPRSKLRSVLLTVQKRQH